MEIIGKIRRMYFRDSMSLHEITERTSLSRHAIRKWLRSTGEVAQPTYQRSQMPCELTAFHEALERGSKRICIGPRPSRISPSRCYFKKWKK